MLGVILDERGGEFSAAWGDSLAIVAVPRPHCAGVNDSADALLAAIARSESEVAPSTVFAVASILEGCTYINGSPQNTFVPGVVDLAARHGVFIAGGAAAAGPGGRVAGLSFHSATALVSAPADDFKSGQTKFKSVLVDFLVSAGIKPLSIVSYNHLGNNDGMNLSAPQTFRSKEISKSNVVDDMVESNPLLYKKGEHPDHVVVIKYVPSVGDSKRALDEFTSKIFMNSTNTISIFHHLTPSHLSLRLTISQVPVGGGAGAQGLAIPEQRSRSFM